PGGFHRDGDRRARRRVLGRVRQEVPHYALDGVGIGERLDVRGQVELDPVLLEQAAELLDHVPDRITQRDETRGDREGVPFQPGEVEEVVDQALEGRRVAGDAVDELPA